MGKRLLRDQVFPVRGIRLRRLAEELRPDEAGHHIRQHCARPTGVGVYVPGRAVRPTGPAHGAGVWDVAPAEALLLLLLGVRSVLPELPPGPTGDRQPDAGDRRAVFKPNATRALESVISEDRK